MGFDVLSKRGNLNDKKSVKRRQIKPVTSSQNMTKKHKKRNAHLILDNPLPEGNRRKRSKRIKTSEKYRSFFSEVDLLREGKLFIVILTTVIVLLVVISSLFFSIKQSSGYGMMPSLRHDDVLLVKRKSELKRFDLVRYDNGLEGEFRRVIGFPGERIEYKEDLLYVNNEPIDEKFIVDKVNEYEAKGSVFTTDFSLYDISKVREIPKNSYLLLGDNRPYTTDSREYGVVKKEKILGKVIARIWPIETAIKF